MKRLGLLAASLLALLGTSPPALAQKPADLVTVGARARGRPAG